MPGGYGGQYNPSGISGTGAVKQYSNVPGGTPGGAGVTPSLSPAAPSSGAMSSPQIQQHSHLSGLHGGVSPTGGTTPPERYSYGTQSYGGIPGRSGPTSSSAGPQRVATVGGRSTLVSGASTPVSRSARPSGGFQQSPGLPSSQAGGRTPPLVEYQQSAQAQTGLATEVNSRLSSLLHVGADNSRDYQPVIRSEAMRPGPSTPKPVESPQVVQHAIAPNYGVSLSGQSPKASAVPYQVEGGSAADGPLDQLFARIEQSLARREQAMREEEVQTRQIEELIARSKAEISGLTSQTAQLQRLQQNNGLQPSGPERPSIRGRPPFYWQPSQDYVSEFEVGGECGEVVTKVRDFEDQGWVIPVGGTLRLVKGGVYRWTLRIERKCPYRPQLQFGVHGLGHNQPWRLVTTSRCSRSKDDDPWQDRPGGDRLIDEGDFIHLEVDLRGLHVPYGVFSMAINDEQPEVVFEDIPLNTNAPIMPVVSMGGDQSRVRLCPSY